MATYRGTTGSVTYNASTVAQVTGWELTVALDILDDTALGEKWRGQTGGLASGSGRMSLVLDYTTGQKELLDDLLAATPTLVGATAVFTMDTGKYIQAVIIPSGATITDRADAIVTLEVPFVVDGAPTAISGTWS